MPFPYQFWIDAKEFRMLKTELFGSALGIESFERIVRAFGTHSNSKLQLLLLRAINFLSICYYCKQYELTPRYNQNDQW